MRERVAAARKLVEAIRASLPARDASGARHRRPPAASAAAQARPAPAQPCPTRSRMPLPAHAACACLARLCSVPGRCKRTLQTLTARAGSGGAAAAGGHARHAARAGRPGARAARQRARAGAAGGRARASGRLPCAPAPPARRAPGLSCRLCGFVRNCFMCKDMKQFCAGLCIPRLLPAHPSLVCCAGARAPPCAAVSAARVFAPVGQAAGRRRRRAALSGSSARATPPVRSRAAWHDAAGGTAQARAVELAQGRPELAVLEALEAGADELPGVVPELEPLRACAPAQAPCPHPALSRPPGLRARGREACAAEAADALPVRAAPGLSGQGRRMRPWHVACSTVGAAAGVCEGLSVAPMTTRRRERGRAGCWRARASGASARSRWPRSACRSSACASCCTRACAWARRCRRWTSCGPRSAAASGRRPRARRAAGPRPPARPLAARAHRFHAVQTVSGGASHGAKQEASGTGAAAGHGGGAQAAASAPRAPESRGACAQAGAAGNVRMLPAP